MYCKIIAVILTLFASCLTAQPQIDRLQLFNRGGGASDTFSDIYYTAEEDFFVCGSSSYNPWALCIDTEGNVQWEYTDEGQSLSSVIQADNGDAVTVGRIGDNMCGAIRIDRDGEVVWRREYFRGGASAVIELKNNNFLLCGPIVEGDCGYVMMVDSDGEPLWLQSYGEVAPISSLNAMRETDDGIVLVGRSAEYGGIIHGWTKRGWMLKIDHEQEGEVIWSNLYEAEYPRTYLQFHSIISTDFGFAVGGTQGTSQGKFALYLINSNGQLQEAILYSEQYWSRLQSINKLSDGGYILIGKRGHGVRDRMYPVAIRTNSDGNTLWTNDFSEIIEEQPEPDGTGSAGNILRSVLVLPGDIIVACGYMYNNNQRQFGVDGLIVRLEADTPSPIIEHWSPKDTVLTVLQGDTTVFTVIVRDQQGDVLHHNWFWDNHGVMGDTSVTIIWDYIGDYVVQYSVSDGERVVGMSWSVEVTEMLIDSYTPDSLDVSIHRNTTVDFSVVTRSTEGDPVEYQWVIDNEIIPDEVADTFSFTFEQGRNHEVEAIAYRGELWDNVIWQVTMEEMIVSFWPRQFDLEVTADTIMEFMIEPFDPQDASLNILWTANGDSIGNRTWVFIDFDSIGEQQVAVFVSDSVSSDSMSWTIQVNPNSVNQHDFSLLPDIPTLYPPTPNPFNSQTTVRYALPASGQVRLELFDINGRLITQLINQNQTAGWHDVVVDGIELVSGVYIIRMIANNDAIVKKVVLIR